MKTITHTLFGLNTTVGIPLGVLSSSVECFFELKGKPEYKIHRLLPKGTSEILFNLGEPFYGDTTKPSSNNLKRINCKHFLISGIKTGYLDSFAVDYFHCVGIRFKIDGIKKLLNIAPVELTDNDFELDTVISKNIAQYLYESLNECSTTSQRFNLLENWLFEKLSHSKSNDKNAHIINTILSKPFLPVKVLEVETRYSRQYLHKKFKEETGISIKKYQEIIRIGGVLSSIRNNPQELIQTVYSNGYFDQSHFIRDFKSITGLVPTSYIASSSPHTLDPYLF